MYLSKRSIFRHFQYCTRLGKCELLLERELNLDTTKLEILNNI